MNLWHRIQEVSTYCQGEWKDGAISVIMRNMSKAGPMRGWCEVWDLLCCIWQILVWMFVHVCDPLVTPFVKLWGDRWLQEHTFAQVGGTGWRYWCNVDRVDEHCHGRQQGASPWKFTKVHESPWNELRCATCDGAKDMPLFVFNFLEIVETKCMLHCYYCPFIECNQFHSFISSVCAQCEQSRPVTRSWPL